jgi:hypothetical protein
VGGFIIIGLVVGFATFCLIRRRNSRSPRKGNPQIEESQRQYQSGNITPYMAPGFSSPKPIPSSQDLKSQVPQPLSRNIFLVRTLCISTWIVHSAPNLGQPSKSFSSSTFFSACYQYRPRFEWTIPIRFLKRIFGTSPLFLSLGDAMGR